MITKGIAKYVYLDSTEKFQGEDTGKYTLTVALDSKEAKAREPSNKSEFLDLCNVCRYHSNPYTWIDDDEVINIEDINLDNP